MTAVQFDYYGKPVCFIDGREIIPDSARGDRVASVKAREPVGGGNAAHVNAAGRQSSDEGRGA